MTGWTGIFKPSKERVEEQSTALLPLNINDDNDFQARDGDKSFNSAPPNDTGRLSIPDCYPLRKSLDSTSDLSLYSADNSNERQSHRLLSPHNPRLPSLSPALPPPPHHRQTWRSRTSSFWTRNKGLALVVLSQLCAALMSTATRLLETTTDANGEAMGTLPVLFARFSITLVLSSLYLHYAKVPDAPFGKKEVRWLLVARGLGGFFGVYGLYYSLKYLPLSEATVITFLGPIASCWVCAIILHEEFTRKEQVAAILSFLGVVMIARPASLFGDGGKGDTDAPDASGLDGGVVAANITTTTAPFQEPDVSPRERLIAIGIALVGVAGATVAYTTIRWIGRRAHPLISVNYFAFSTTLISTLLLLFPHFSRSSTTPTTSTSTLPSSPHQWLLLLFMGLSGFATQFLLTAGLQYEKGARATNMVYTAMLFALAFDKLVWGHVPGWGSLAGSGVILGCAVFVAVNKGEGKEVGEGDEEVGDGERVVVEMGGVGEEEEGERDDDDDDGCGGER